MRRSMVNLILHGLIAVTLLSPGDLAADTGVVLGVRPAGPEGVSQAPAQQVTDFEVRPSVRTTTLNRGDQTLDLFVACIDLFTGAILPFCDVQLHVEALAGSGGHVHHDGDRPPGDFDPASGNTGADGFLDTVYTAPEISGVISVLITGTTQNGLPVLPGVASIGVRIPNLVGLPVSGPGFSTTGSTGHGTNNRFATQGVITDLLAVPMTFREELVDQGVAVGDVPEIVYTSICLVEGGLFDVDATGDGQIDNPWLPPHRSHRFGTDVDVRIRNIPARFRDELQTAILNSGRFFFPVQNESPAAPNASHWHLRQR